MSLYGWWRFDGDFTDSHQDFDAYSHGANYAFSSGKLGQCLDLTSNSGDDGAELLKDADADPTREEGAYSLWFKSTTTTGDPGARIIARDASEHPTVIIDQSQSSGQNFSFYLRSPNLSVGSATENEWHHLVVSWSASTGEWFIMLDGSIITDNDTYGTDYSVANGTARPIVIGGNTEGDGDISGNPFVGYVDDVRVFTHHLSQEEAVKLSRAKFSHWKLNGTVQDNGPYALHGTNNGTTMTGDSPVNSQAMEFTKSGGENVNISIPFSPQKFTVSFWVNPHGLDTTTNNDYRAIIEPDNTNNFILIEQDGGVSFRVPGVNTTNFTAGSIPTNSWTHVACVYDQTDRIIYVNGSEVGRNNIGSGTVNLGSWINFAYGVASGLHQFDGVLSDVQFRAEPLTGSQIQRLYENRAALDDQGNYHTHEVTEVGNVVQHPGFESAPETLQLKNNASRSTTTAYEGSYSLYAVQSGDSQWKRIWHMDRGVDGSGFMEPGETWTMGFYAKSTCSFNCGLGHMGGGGWMGTSIAANSSWNWYETTDTVPEGVSNNEFGYRDGTQADGDIYIDNVVFAPGDTIPSEMDYTLRSEGVAEARGVSEMAVGNTERKARQTEYTTNLFSDTDAYAQSWSGHTYYNGSVTTDTTRAWVGDQSFKVTTDGSSGTPDGFITENAGPLASGTTIAAELYIWVPSGESVDVSYRLRDPDVSNKEGVNSVTVSGSDSWELVQLAPYTLSNQYDNVHIQGHEPSNTGTVWSFWIDTLQIRTDSANAAFGDEILQADSFNEV